MWRVPRAMATAVPVVEGGQAVKGTVQGEAGDHADRVGIGERRAVAVKIGENVQTLGKAFDAKLVDSVEHLGVGVLAEIPALDRARRGCDRARRRLRIARLH